MNVMGSIQPQSLQNKQSTDIEYSNLYKAVNLAVNSIAQMSPLQQSIFQTQNSASSIPNSGRIIFFTSAKHRNIDQIQENLNKAIEECNKRIDSQNRQFV